MAIGESPSKKLKLCQIYDWIKERFPYYRVSQYRVSGKKAHVLLSRVRIVRVGRTLSDTICLSMNVSSRCQVKVELRGRETIGC